MRAIAAFPEEKALRVIDHPAPTLERPDEVLFTILEVGLCGTDREIARFQYGDPPPDSSYLVLGHESLGQVLEVGAGVTRMKPGDLVVSSVRRPCPHATCVACRNGRQDFCTTGDFTERGIRKRHGFMIERVVEEERFLHVMPRHLAEVGVLLEPLTIAEKALRQVWDVQERLPWTVAGSPQGQASGQRAVVLGSGPVGLLGALALLGRGFETWVYSRDVSSHPKARWVESVGAHHLSSQDVAVERLREHLGAIDLVYEATGAAAFSFRALEALGPNGVFIFTGVPGRKAPFELQGAELMRRMVLRNQLVFGTVNAGPDAFEQGIADLALFHARWPAALRGLITQRAEPEQVPELLTGERAGIKQVVRFAKVR